MDTQYQRDIEKLRKANEALAQARAMQEQTSEVAVQQTTTDEDDNVIDPFMLDSDDQ